MADVVYFQTCVDKPHIRVSSICDPFVFTLLWSSCVYESIQLDLYFADLQQFSELSHFTSIQSP